MKLWHGWVAVALLILVTLHAVKDRREAEQAAAQAAYEAAKGVAQQYELGARNAFLAAGFIRCDTTGGDVFTPGIVRSEAYTRGCTDQQNGLDTLNRGFDLRDAADALRP